MFLTMASSYQSPLPDLNLEAVISYITELTQYDDMEDTDFARLPTRFPELHSAPGLLTEPMASEQAAWLKVADIACEARRKIYALGGKGGSGLELLTPTLDSLAAQIHTLLPLNVDVKKEEDDETVKRRDMLKEGDDVEKYVQSELLDQTTFAIMQTWRSENERYMCDIGKIIEKAIGISGEMWEHTWAARNRALKEATAKQLAEAEMKIEAQNDTIKEMKLTTEHQMRCMMDNLKKELATSHPPPPAAAPSPSPPPVKAPPAFANPQPQQPSPFPTVFNKAPPPVCGFATLPPVPPCAMRRDKVYKLIDGILYPTDYPFPQILDPVPEHYYCAFEPGGVSS